ncbi:MAG: hypothetical protein RLZZ612_1728 [Pseudomonadota bacterium]|jgi:peptidoglycan/LPS O-acetylase OafA/YrhL
MNVLTDFLDTKKQNNIDLLRAIAVSAVFIHHAQHVFGGAFPFFGTYGGEFGVQLFFVISGYLIAASWEKSAWQDYMIHRVCRILPAYLFFMVTVGVVSKSITLEKIQAHPLEFILNMVMMQHLSPSALAQFDTLHVTWTLTIEVLWYVTAPLFIFLLTKHSTLTLLGAIGISSLWSFSAQEGFLNFIYPSIHQPGSIYLFISNHFIAQLCFFVLGAWFYKSKQKFDNANPLAFLLLGLTVFLLRPYYAVFNPIFISGLGLLCFLIAAVFLPSIKNRIVYFLSTTSYSIYLIHFPILMWVGNKLKIDGALGLAVSIGMILVVSGFSYVLVEKVGIQFSKKLSQKC